MKKKSIALLLAIAIVVVGVVAGTLAWLTDTTDPVTNTFTTSDINIELKETTTEYKMIPGYEIPKDPKAKVLTGSEECYLFVKFVKSENFNKYMTYTPAAGWTKLEDASVTDEVYYRVVKTADIGTEYSVLAGDKVTVLNTVTKTDMEAAKTAQPTLTFTAYASQLYKSAGTEFSVLEAWNNVKDLT